MSNNRRSGAITLITLGTVIAGLLGIMLNKPDETPYNGPVFAPCGIEVERDARGFLPPLENIFAEYDNLNGFDMQYIQDINGIDRIDLPFPFDENRELYCLTGTIRKMNNPDYNSQSNGESLEQITEVATSESTAKQEAPAEPTYKKFVYDNQPLNTKNFAEGASAYFSTIEKAAKKYNLDPNLIAAVITQESSWLDSVAYGKVLSRSGAVGLMQVMPKDGIAATFMCLDDVNKPKGPVHPCFRDRPTIAQLSDPTFNIMYGAKVLRQKIDHFGSARDGLKGYGPIYKLEKDAYDYANIVLQRYRYTRIAEGYQ